MSTVAFAYPTQEQKPAAKPLRVARGGRYGVSKARRIALWTLVGALLLVMIVSVVQSQAQVTELSGKIEKTRKELTNAQSTYDYLSDQMSSITSSTNVQQIAEGRLGLVRADASQITYIKLQGESTVVRASTGFEQMMEGFRTTALSLIGSLDP